MKKRLNLFRVLLNVVLAIMVATFIAPIIGVAPLAVSSAIFVLGLVLSFSSEKNTGILATTLQTHAFTSDIQETLFFENEFINLAVDHSAYIKDLTVHIPLAGAKPNVVKNRTENVANLQRRTDTELTYNLTNYTTDPFLVKDIEDIQASYSKRQSLMGQHIATLSDTIAVETLHAWAVSGSTSHVIRTTGANDAMLPHDTATGARLRFRVEDLARAAARMDLDKVPKKGRFAVVPTTMFYGLFSDKELLNQRALIGEDMLKMGVVAELFTFKIIVRGEVVKYTNAAANNLRAVGSAAAATDCDGAICFSRYMVTQALGDIMVYLNVGDAKSFGDIMSAEVNHGASVLRSENVGRVSIAQGYEAP